MKFKRHATVDKLLADALPDGGAAVDAMNRLFNEDAVSRNLRILRSVSGVSQTEMAKRLGVSQSVVSRIENDGNYPGFNDVVRYINALGFSAELACVRGGRQVDFLASYFSRITKTMDTLRELAGGDPDITQGVMNAFLAFSKSMMEDVLPRLKDKLPCQTIQLEFSLNPDERRPPSPPEKPRRKNRRGEVAA